MSKKERIIQAAMDAFREQGIEKTKISDIVKKAGVAQGTFYIYFPSKLAVMPSIAEVMVEKSLNKIKDTVCQDKTFLHQLRQVVDVTFSITEEYREIHALIYAGLASTEYLQEWEAIYAPYYTWMSRFLAEAQHKGVIHDSIAPEQTATILIGLIESAAEQIYLYSHTDNDMAERKKESVIQFAAAALGIKE